MSNVHPFPVWQRGAGQVGFERLELMRILDLYGRMVAAGLWRDYAIDLGRDAAVFSAFRRTAERPEFRIEKRPALRLRQGEWAFFLRVADAGADGVHVDDDFTDREIPNVLNPQRFTSPVSEGKALETEQLDGTEEAVSIWPDSLEGETVMVGIELPDGVTMQPFGGNDELGVV